MKKTQNKLTSDQVTSLPGYGDVDNMQFAGYASIDSKKKTTSTSEKLFYWFVGAEDYANQPTIIWTNGGPGSSSFWGFFLENGPYTVESAIGDYPILKPRASAWNNYANYMIFEHPLSVTLSFANDDANVPKTPQGGAKEYYNALLNFLELHPEIAENPIILAGESYAGTYLPLIAKEIMDGNDAGNMKIKLHSTVLADAWVSPMVQMTKNTEYAFTHGLISQEQKTLLDKEFTGDRLANINSEIAKLCGCYMANTAEAGDPPFDPVLLYLNRADVRKAIHVDSDEQLVDTWSEVVSENYTPHVNESVVEVIQELLDRNHTIQIISGLNDAKDCNFLGTGAWLNELEGAASFELMAATPQQWKNAEDTVIGFYQDGGQLSWLRVLNAGHLAVNDQPLIIEKILEKGVEDVS